MCRTWVALILVTSLALSGQSQVRHRDYVPDEKTAEKIADAVLVGQYGEARVEKLRPLHVESVSKDSWLVQGLEQGKGVPEKGAGVGVWINKHSGCVQVMDHMK